MKAKLYSHPNSTYSRRVRMYAVEKGLELQIEDVAMERLAHRKPDYLAVHPLGRVPVLELNGRRLYESSAILEYLEDLLPEPPLRPAGVYERAVLRQELSVCDHDFAGPATRIYFAKRFLPEAKWRREEMQTATKTIKRSLVYLENRLGDREYLLDDFGIADVAYAPFLQFRELLELQIPPAVEAWSQRLLQRPSAKQTAPPA